MDGEILSFEVYAPTRGNPLSMSHDGELTLRLSVPLVDRDAAIALCDALRALRDGDDTPLPVRLVAVDGVEAVGDE